MTTPPRCAVWYCTATTLHHHFLSASGAQHPEQWVRCGASASARCYGKVCVPPFFHGLRGDGVMSVVRPPYRYPAPLRDLQRWSDLPPGRVWITRVWDRYDWKGWEVSWRVRDTRRRYCLPSFEQAVAFARESVCAHPREVS